MSHPLLYEINTRCWLRELTERQPGMPVTLATVPDAELAYWRRLGFTYIWLMGVWTSGPRSRDRAAANADFQRGCRELLPDFQAADVIGSPYAIAAYTVAADLGGDAGLKILRGRLHEHGLKLLLDFVPNHVGLDHPWLTEKPEMFVHLPADAPEGFWQPTRAGRVRLAHGKDPNFPAWHDTAQLELRNPQTRRELIRQLLGVARCCDGVRCDMAMLVLNEVFARTWAGAPAGMAMPATEFWAEVIPAVKQAQPDFLLLAEAYWDLEARLQSLGFDFTYDKRVYDELVARRPAALAERLSGVSREFLERGVHFLENHDEARVAELLPFAEQRAAALLTLGLPGLPLLHEGQLEGAVKRAKIHLRRRPVEPANPEVAAFYERLLTTLPRTAVGVGRWHLLRPTAAWPGNPTHENFVVIQWQSDPDSFDLVLVNLAAQAGQCRVALVLDPPAPPVWRVANRLGEERFEQLAGELARNGLLLDLPAHGAQLLHFKKAANPGPC